MSWLPATSQGLLHNKIIKGKILGLQKLTRQQRNIAKESNVSMEKRHLHSVEIRGDVVEVHTVKESSKAKKKKDLRMDGSQISTSQATPENISVKYFQFKL